MFKYKLFLSVLLSAFICSTASAKVVEKIIAIVGSEIVTKTDLDQYRKKLKSGGLVDDALLKLADKDKLLNDRQALIDHLINERVIDSEVDRRGLSVTIERVEQEIRNIVGRNGITRDQLKQALAEKGVSFSEYQDFIKTSLEREALIGQEVSSKIKISDEDISSYYLAKQGNADAKIFEYKLAHILFRPKGGDVEAAEQRAKDLLVKLKNGASFDAMASQYSEDPNFTQGGLLGSFKAGEMIKEMETAVSGLDEGAISDIVRTRAGFHIIKVLDKTLVPDPAFEHEKAKIHNTLYAQAFHKQLKSWLQDKREEIFVRINES